MTACGDRRDIELKRRLRSKILKLFCLIKKRVDVSIVPVKKRDLIAKPQMYVKPHNCFTDLLLFTFLLQFAFELNF